MDQVSGPASSVMGGAGKGKGKAQSPNPDQPTTQRPDPKPPGTLLELLLLSGTKECSSLLFHKYVKLCRTHSHCLAMSVSVAMLVLRRSCRTCSMLMLPKVPFVWPVLPRMTRSRPLLQFGGTRRALSPQGSCVSSCPSSNWAMNPAPTSNPQAMSKSTWARELPWLC